MDVEKVFRLPLEKPEQYGIINYLTCVSLKIAYR